jgi:hypothetical protein
MDIQFILDTFAGAFPDVHKRSLEVSRDWYLDEPPGPYLVFNESIALPILDPMLEGSGTSDEMEAFFDCVEVVLRDADIDLENLIKVEVLERLLSRDVWLRRAEPYLGPLTAMLLQEFDLRLKWLARAPGVTGA